MVKGLSNGNDKPLRNRVDEFITYFMEMSWELIDPIAHVAFFAQIDLSNQKTYLLWESYRIYKLQVDSGSLQHS